MDTVIYFYRTSLFSEEGKRKEKNKLDGSCRSSSADIAQPLDLAYAKHGGPMVA